MTKIFRWLFVAALLMILLLATLKSSPELVQLCSANDKVNHLLAFVALQFLSKMAGLTFKQRLLTLLIYGLSIEIVQSCLAWRSAEWADLLADALGVLIGELICLIISVVKPALKSVPVRKD